MTQTTSTETGTNREVNVADRVRTIRRRRGISVRTLAAAAGFSPSFISQIELGQVSPSIASLERLAGALNVAVAALVSEEAPSPAGVIRASDRPHVLSVWSRARLEPLAPAGAASQLDPVLITLAPGDQSGAHAPANQGETFAIVFDGELTLTLGDESHVLHRGDAVSYHAGAHFCWENTGLEPASVLVVSCRSAH